MTRVDRYFRNADHGPLPAMLLVLTIATGLVDAASILGLGKVFVANMTGNIAFIGFGLAGAAGFSVIASLFALVGFLAGAALGGVFAKRWAANRAVLLRNAVGGEVIFLGTAALVAALAAKPIGDVPRDITVTAAALALGLRNAAVRKLAVPDLTTTVLTMTLTGIAADIRSGRSDVAIRRLLSVAAMLLGAIVGTILVLHVSVGAALAAAAALALIVLIGTTLAARQPAAWQ